MAAGRGFYAVERCGRRDGYVAEDVQGEVPRGGTADKGVDGDEEGDRDGDGDGDKDGDGDGEEKRERGPEALGSTVLSGEVLEKWRVGCEVGFSAWVFLLGVGVGLFCFVRCGGM